MMADNKEQRVWVKFCFLLGKSAAETVLMLQEAFKEEEEEEGEEVYMLLLRYIHTSNAHYILGQRQFTPCTAAHALPYLQSVAPAV